MNMSMDGSVEVFYQRAVAQLGRAGLGATMMHIGFSQMREGLLRSDQAMFTEGWNRLRSGDDYLCHALKTEDSEEPAASILAALCTPNLTSTSRITREVSDDGGMSI